MTAGASSATAAPASHEAWPGCAATDKLAVNHALYRVAQGFTPKETCLPAAW